MHKSRLVDIVIDCQDADIEKAGSFWGSVFGYELHRFTDPADANYIRLVAPSGGPRMLVQKVTHTSRVHIDIETNDIDAEVERLEKLGAKRIEQVREWWILEAPTGHRFCVLPPQTKDFEKNATKWP